MLRVWLLGLVLGVCALGACSKKNEVDIDNGPSGNENINLGSCDPEGVAEPGTAGPAMRYVGKLDDGCMWVDETEVTATQFADFSAASDASDSLPSECSADGWEPVASEATSSADPVVGVDWCTAAAFCAWAGKRLCREYETDAGRVESELESTCTDGDNADFKYSELTQAESGCNVDADGLREAGAEAGCSSPTGVLDLVGNAAEWTAECDSEECRARGGSHQDTGSSVGCDARRSWPRDTQRDDLGFRCCADRDLLAGEHPQLRAAVNVARCGPAGARIRVPGRVAPSLQRAPPPRAAANEVQRLGVEIQQVLHVRSVSVAKREQLVDDEIFHARDGHLHPS